MKKLMMTVAMAAAMVAFGEEKCEGEACPLPAAAAPVMEQDAKPEAPKTPDREAMRKLREERQQQMQERFAAVTVERKQKVAKLLVEAGLDEVKAKELAEKVNDVYSGPVLGGKHQNRPNRRMRRPPENGGTVPPPPEEPPKDDAQTEAPAAK